VGEADHGDDLKLVERMLAGEEDAFAAFGERYFKAVYRFALARLDGDRDLTREVVQTAMTKALSKLDTYRGEAALLTWLCSCCRNEILMHFRRRQTAPVGVELTAEVDPDPGSQRLRDPEATLLKQERAHLVHVALDGLSVNEIAWRLGVLPKAAESLLTRARQAFRTLYESLQKEVPDHGRTGSDD